MFRCRTAPAKSSNAVVEYGATWPGTTVLVQDSGGVSIFALQFARALGAEVIALSSSDEQLQRAKKIGAAHGINYQATPEWDKSSRRGVAASDRRHRTMA